MSETALWWAVIGSGLYHGVNPGMGWPLAVSAALMEGRSAALWKALGLLALGHLLAMLLILLPVSLVAGISVYQRELRVAAGLVVVAMGLWLLINRRHPRMLARVHPARLALWSFLAATAHGAGLMLVPIYFGLDGGHAGHGGAVTVALAHTLAMSVGAGAVAVAVHRWLGLKFLSRSWFNLDLVWALSLVLVGAFGVWAALSVH